jgi:hypothetical protein
LSSWHAKSASGVDRILYKSVSILWYRPNKCVFDVDRYIFQLDYMTSRHIASKRNASQGIIALTAPENCVTRVTMVPNLDWSPRHARASAVRATIVRQEAFQVKRLCAAILTAIALRVLLLLSL